MITQLRVALACVLQALLSATGCTQTPTHVYLQTIPAEEYDRNILYYADQAADGTSLAEVIDATEANLLAFFEALPESKLGYRYAPGKWTVAEVLQHIITYEHIMRESLLNIAGAPAAELQYARYTQASTAYGASDKTKAQLLADFRDARAATRAAVASLTPERLRRVGRHEGFRVSPRVLAVCSMGHQAHHFGVLRKRYGL